MLRVETSNLTHPRGALRSRRLHPNSASSRGSGAAIARPLPPPPAVPSTLPPPPQADSSIIARHELLPPSNTASAPVTELVLPHEERTQPSKRWSLRLELADEEIAQLYAQGLARGAVVWKKGMVEWRPLLITQELHGLLQKTQLGLSERGLHRPSNASPGPSFPRAARLPQLEASHEPSGARAIPTLAPLANDVQSVPTPQRRRLELLSVAALSFMLAWGAHSIVAGSPSAAAPGAAESAAQPLASPARPALPTAVKALSSSSEPRVISVSDLPLLGAEGSGSARGRRRSSGLPGDGPSRSDLVAALGQVQSSASSCGERGGPVRVVVTFANSGVARSIQVSGAQLPSATRSCILHAASRARVSAFSGEPVTVSKRL